MAILADEFTIDREQCRVVHTPTNYAFSFPDRAHSGDLQLWQVVETGRHNKRTPESRALRQAALEFYVATLRSKEETLASVS